MIVDTHAFLWWAEDSPRLSVKARVAFSDGRVRLLWSVASTWELAIKVGVGRLRLPEPVLDYVMSRTARHGIDSLALEHSHVARVATLPHHHSDPFDRVLIAQALVEGVPVLTADPRFEEYGVEVVR
jgi:PIN domain nuclease of toxin-antitoxin system